MSKTKTYQTRKTPGQKINKLLLTWPRGRKVTSNKANNTDMASSMVGDNSEILKEIRNMNQELQQKIQKTGDDMKANWTN